MTAKAVNFIFPRGVGENIQGFRVFYHKGGNSLLSWPGLPHNGSNGQHERSKCPLSPRPSIVHIRLTVHYDIGTDETLVKLVPGLFPDVKITYEIALCKFRFRLGSLLIISLLLKRILIQVSSCYLVSLRD